MAHVTGSLDGSGPTTHAFFFSPHPQRQARPPSLHEAPARCALPIHPPSRPLILPLTSSPVFSSAIFPR